ncbi:YrrS family protein [Halalkalibacterium halodurans]|uniref:BH1277 protein n=1 Tax=Halalkalibacterium halodurans (strain ATCC BAA-125 / DSM 18197 / FERM 7344 / JCM 9153 / C-125) TaxID=272558 RepID=Q9KDD6_HALH5|nr:YrrS family protein [Halalkalibacterium halodurans]MED4171027.1 YrrS family protein [Halalkalibacterium halodurans]BAB04996.1 BH1277 [Halalkalibacterium halodurans C-125]
MPRSRLEARKKRRVNTFLNVAIGVVALLIIYYTAQLFINPGADETTADVEETNEQEQNGANSDSATDGDSNDPDGQEVEEQEEETVEAGVEDGEWEPIGTQQTGEFSHDFTRGSTNWNEMVRAIEYATGLSGDEYILERLENGGTATTARGIVSLKGDRGTQYQVTIEFIEGEGWMPIELIEP